MSSEEYLTWSTDQTPENMAGVLKTLDPTINSEIQRYSGPKPILRGKAKQLAIGAIRKYDPTKGAQLNSWVVTSLQPLSRYGQQLRPIHASEMAIRQAAEVNTVRERLSDTMGRDPSVDELADETGLSVKRIKHIRSQVKPTVSESVFDAAGEDQASSSPGVQTSDTMGFVKETIYESLTPRDKQIYDWKTGNHGKPTLPNGEIAKRLGVTPALITQRSTQISTQIQDLYGKESG